jgi:putative acetyltransferase
MIINRRLYGEDDATTRIRPENPADSEAVRQVHLQAFRPSAAEARLVDLLRRAGKATISLVATSGGRVIGHIMFSRVDLVPDSAGLQGIGLAPVGVLPVFQGRGVGSELVLEGLKVCRRMGFDFCVVLGEPRFYARFGFQPASGYGLRNEYNADEAFRVIELRRGVLRGVGGLVKYQPEFLEVQS